MRIQLIFFLCLISVALHASEEGRIKELVNKYEKIMKHHQVELTSEVFTKKFLQEHGGKDAFIDKIKELPKVEEKKNSRPLLRGWKKGKTAKTFFAKIKNEEQKKSTHSQLIIIEEDGELKIDGSISNGQ